MDVASWGLMFKLDTCSAKGKQLLDQMQDSLARKQFVGGATDCSSSSGVLRLQGVVAVAVAFLFVVFVVVSVVGGVVWCWWCWLC